MPLQSTLMRVRALISFGFLALTLACGDREAGPPVPAAPPAAAATPAAEPAPVPDPEPPDDRVSVVFLGDSLTAGYELDLELLDT